MVRAVAGTLQQVGEGKLMTANVKEILDSGDRSLAGATSPAQGLYMVRVLYPKDSLGSGVLRSTRFGP